MYRPAQSASTLILTTTTAGAVLLSPLLLVMSINGLFLGILVLPLFPLLAFGWLGLSALRQAARHGVAIRVTTAALVEQPVAIARRRPEIKAWVVRPERKPAPATVLAQAEAAAAPVRLRVASAHGVCPVGYQFEMGTEYIFQNGAVSPEICPVARRALMPFVAQVRRGEIPTTLKPFCKTAVHEVVFEFAAGAPVAVSEAEPALR
ncbi:MAG: hypothetical protein HY682_10540 [Chloroflexi bacterium]|nr:hypothetical protein [Chloroflexota bacterium]